VPAEETKEAQTLWTLLCFLYRLAVERKSRVSNYPFLSAESDNGVRYPDSMSRQSATQKEND